MHGSSLITGKYLAFFFMKEVVCMLTVLLTVSILGELKRGKIKRFFPRCGEVA